MRNTQEVISGAELSAGALNGLLEAEVRALCDAQRYVCSMERMDTRAGHYECWLQTKTGEVTLQVPGLRTLPVMTQTIERCPRRESRMFMSTWHRGNQQQ